MKFFFKISLKIRGNISHKSGGDRFFGDQQIYDIVCIVIQSYFSIFLRLWLSIFGSPWQISTYATEAHIIYSKTALAFCIDKNLMSTIVVKNVRI